MQIKATTRLRPMLRKHPQLEEVFGWHDVEIEESSPITLQALCHRFDLDIDEILDDLRTFLHDSPSDGWALIEEDDDDFDDEDLDDEDLDEDWDG